MESLFSLINRRVALYEPGWDGQHNHCTGHVATNDAHDDDNHDHDNDRPKFTV